MVVLLEGMVDATDRAIVLLDQRGTVRRASGRAAALFAAHLGFRLAVGDALPSMLEAWIARFGKPETLEDTRAPGQPLVVEGGHGRLVIRFLPRGEIGEYDALLVEQARDETELGRLSRLTRREREVLSWVSRGKTNPQIAGILSVSAGTIQKHLEHIYDKLGVRTRAAAAVALASEATARL
jgi:DNA-binding CsgD family transcriptional regulator